jgi:hypothetical protein
VKKQKKKRTTDERARDVEWLDAEPEDGCQVSRKKLLCGMPVFVIIRGPKGSVGICIECWTRLLEIASDAHVDSLDLRRKYEPRQFPPAESCVAEGMVPSPSGEGASQPATLQGKAPRSDTHSTKGSTREEPAGGESALEGLEGEEQVGRSSRPVSQSGQKKRGARARDTKGGDRSTAGGIARSLRVLQSAPEAHTGSHRTAGTRRSA